MNGPGPPSPLSLLRCKTLSVYHFRLPVCGEVARSRASTSNTIRDDFLRLSSGTSAICSSLGTVHMQMICLSRLCSPMSDSKHAPSALVQWISILPPAACQLCLSSKPLMLYRLIAAGEDACVRLYDLDKQQSIEILPRVTYPRFTPSPTACLSWYPLDNGMFFSSHRDGHLSIIDTQAQTVLAFVVFGLKRHRRRGGSTLARLYTNMP